MQREQKHSPAVAFEERLKDCPWVRTLGVRPNYSDYNEEERSLIDGAEKIYYPSSFYADLFDTIGKATFPSYHTYKFAQDKILQTALFELAGINHPRTRVFYGKRQMAKILDHFSFPFIAKKARGSALGRGVYLIQSQGDLDCYLQTHKPAYIQEYLPIDRDLRVVVITNKLVHAYWRKASHGSHLTNVAAGGRVDLAGIPDEAIEFAISVARLCKWDDVGLDICMHGGKYYVLEGNMKYGREGFRQAGIEYKQLIMDMIQKGDI